MSAVAQAEAWAEAHHVDGRVTCSSGLKPPSALSARADFICLVRRSPNDCTVLHVSGRFPAGVRLVHKRADCVQPL
jgi:hypothetical protein